MSVPSILMIDDNPGDSELLREAIGESGVAADFHGVASAAEAFAFLGRCAASGARALPDLIVLDLNLPLVDGREILAALQRHERWRHIPVVILSPSRRDEDRVHCTSHGARQFFIKPSQWSEYPPLVHALERLWGHGEATPTASARS